MTKLQEFIWIDKIIKDHGDDSYLGLWLKDHRQAIQQCILGDYPLDYIDCHYQVKKYDQLEHTT